MDKTELISELRDKLADYIERDAHPGGATCRCDDCDEARELLARTDLDAVEIAPAGTLAELRKLVNMVALSQSDGRAFWADDVADAVEASRAILARASAQKGD